MQKWEYLTWIVGYFADANFHEGGRVKQLNGKEIPNWKNSPTLHSALTKAGEDGWELVGFAWSSNSAEPVDPCLIFKRPK